MGVFLVYILKSSVCLSGFYLFYRLLLSRETFHRFNRIAVLGILLLSLLLPLCEVTVERETEVHQTVLSLEQLLLLADSSQQTADTERFGVKMVWTKSLLFVYGLGILFFFCRNVYSLVRMGLLLRRGEREKMENGVVLIVHDKDKLAPFSWMRYIVISRKDLEDSGREILTHEMAHIRNRHSIDLIIADICIYFQWFNPAAWLLKQELQNVHEYEADEAVISEGINAKQYQLLLIKKAVGTRLYSMANSFNHSKLKKRITMMLKKKSNPWARLKYLYVLPLAAVTLTAFARPEVSNELREISEFKVNDLTVNPPTDEEKSSQFRVTLDTERKLELLEGSMERIGEGAWRNTTAVTMTYNSDEEAVQQKDDSARTRYRVQVVKAKHNSEHTVDTVSVDANSPLIIIDGKVATQATLSALNPNSIEAVSVLKDESATKEYGEQGANGVIIVTLISNDKQNDDNAIDAIGIQVVGHKDE